VPQTVTTSANGRGVLRLTHDYEAGDAGPATVVAASGELDLATVPELQRALGNADPTAGRSSSTCARLTSWTAPARIS
jgi:hypothetical protein